MAKKRRKSAEQQTKEPDTSLSADEQTKEKVKKKVGKSLSEIIGPPQEEGVVVNLREEKSLVKRQKKVKKVAAKTVSQPEGASTADAPTAHEPKVTLRKLKSALSAALEFPDATHVVKNTKKRKAFEVLQEARCDQEPQTRNSRKVFVGGIPWSTEEATVRRDFEECGEIEELVMLRDDQDRPKGIAFITFRTKAGAEAALKYDGDDYGGRSLKVAMASCRRDEHSAEKGKAGRAKGKGQDQAKKGKGKGKGGKSKKGDRGEKKRRYGFEDGSEDDGACV